MKVEKIYIGSLYPRTKLHLREFFNFLKYQELEKDLNFNAQKFKKFHKKLAIKNIKYVSDVFDRVEAVGSNVNFEYFEDGLLVLNKKCSEIEKDLAELKNYYNKNLTPFLSEIYSKGTPISLLSAMRPIGRKRTAIIVLSEGTDEEVTEILKQLGSKESHAKVITENFKSYFAPEYIIIITKDFQVKDFIFLINHYIYFREYENHMHEYLNVNRIVWDKVSGIIKKELIRYQDLPIIRDELLSYKENIAIIKTRLSQMNNYLELRKQAAEQLKLLDFLETYKANRFLKIQSIQNYMQKLWSATEESLLSAMELIDSVYQENAQRSLKALQAIFLISVVASFLTLGAMPGADLKIFDLQGKNLANGQIISFDFWTLIRFGIVAIIFSIILYFAWDFIYKLLRKIKIVKMIKK